MAQELDNDMAEEIWRDREGVYQTELACLDCGLITERDVWGNEGEVSECPRCSGVEVGRVD